MDWKVYYADGSTFSDEDGPWEEAPADGVACVVVRDDDYGRYVLNGLNFYYMPCGGQPLDVTHTNDIGPQLRRRCPWLKHGVGLPRSEWKDVLIRATRDPDFGPPRAPKRRSTDREG
jgi:hypothetical protein